MNAQPLLLARREVNELGEPVETRPLKPSERRPQDGDALERERYLAPVTLWAHSSLDDGYWFCINDGRPGTITDAALMDPENGFYYLSRFDGEPVAVELYPPRPMLLSDREPEERDTFEWDESDVFVGDGTEYTITLIPLPPVAAAGKGFSAENCGSENPEWFARNEYKALRYLPRADNGPVTVSTRPKEQNNEPMAIR